MMSICKSAIASGLGTSIHGVVVFLESFYSGNGGNVVIGHSIYGVVGVIILLILRYIWICTLRRGSGEMQINISFTYQYSLACLFVVTSPWVMAQILTMVERHWFQDGHLHPIQFSRLGSTLSPKQQPTDLLPPMDS